MKKFDRKLVMEDGSVYPGFGFGASVDRVCEVVFNTSPVGYQEIASDPSYSDQFVVMTYPLVGNYGVAEDDFESVNPCIGGMVVADYNDAPSNFRSVQTLSEMLEDCDAPGLSGVDTRKLTRSIRDGGTRRAVMTGIDVPIDRALQQIEQTPIPHDSVARASCKKKRYSRTADALYNVVAIDCGMKLNIVRSLKRYSCNVVVVPFNTTAEEIKNLRPDGIFISNGPGDPEDVPETIETIRALRGFAPMFGICLGHQIISLAYGGKTYKLKFGHRGGNHPVKDLETGKIVMTSQNHSYAVDPASLDDAPLNVTRVNLLDGTVEGVECREDKVFSVQYHPESAPGPQDSFALFEKFALYMKEAKNNA